MKKVIIILICVILIFLLLIGGAYMLDSYLMEKQHPFIFSSWGYEYTPEPPALYITDNVVTYQGLLSTNNWHFSGGVTHSDYPSAKEREYSDENTIVVNKESVFHLENSQGKIENIRITKDAMEKNLEFKGSSFTIDYMAPGTYYMEIRMKFPQGTVIYDFKLMWEFGSLEAVVSKSKDTKVIYGKIKQPQEEHQSSMLSYEYKVYYYGLSEVYIELNGSKYPLFNALRDNRITMEDIILKCEEDAKKGIIKSEMYKDGGSKVYKYKDYTIIKYNTLGGNKDIYIGIPEMNISVGNL